MADPFTLAMDKALVRQVKAAGVLFRTFKGEVLFVKRAGVEGKDNYVGYWSLPGGGIEDGESAIDAAQRECREELGDVPMTHLALLDVSANGFRTYAATAPKKFSPTLNAEHSEFRWGTLKNPPRPLHPGVRETIDKLAASEDMITGDMAPENTLAFDKKASLRTYDVDKRLHVALTHISKSNVCPYRGKEIPGFEALGLDPERIYQLYRDPDELAKGASTFNNLPLLSEHVPVNALDHHPELVIGSTGTDAVFVAPYLDNSLVVWVQDEIEGIESEEKEQLSSAYRYRVDMTSGTVDGVKYDGVMRDIVGNHVALVPEGRAGDDVVVGDAKPQETFYMPALKKKGTVVSLTPRAIMAMGVLTAGLKPLLAQDAKIDLTTMVKPMSNLTTKNFGAKKAGMLTALTAMTKGKLAQDATLDSVVAMLDSLEGTAEVIDGIDADPTMTQADPVDPDATSMDDDPLAFLAGKCSDEEMAKLRDMIAGKAMDEPEPFKGEPKVGAKDAEEDDDDKEKGKNAPPFGKDKEPDMSKDKDMVTKPAMDAAIAKAVRGAGEVARKNFTEVREAERFVKPWVGELEMACDSAEGVFRKTLEALEVEVPDGIPTAGLKAMIGLVPQPGAKKVTALDTPLGMDAAATKSFHERFPGAKRIGQM